MYDVQVTTDFGETIVLTVSAGSAMEAEMAAINMVESGYTDTIGKQVVDCFAL